MDHMMINENKIKLVTGAAGVYFTALHIPPKMFVYHIFFRKNEVSQNIKQKMEFKTIQKKPDHK